MTVRHLSLATPRVLLQRRQRFRETGESSCTFQFVRLEGTSKSSLRFPMPNSRSRRRPRPTRATETRVGCDAVASNGRVRSGTEECCQEHLALPEHSASRRLSLVALSLCLLVSTEGADPVPTTSNRGLVRGERAEQARSCSDFEARTAYFRAVAHVSCCHIAGRRVNVGPKSPVGDRFSHPAHDSSCADVLCCRARSCFCLLMVLETTGASCSLATALQTERSIYTNRRSSPACPCPASQTQRWLWQMQLQGVHTP